MKQILTIKPGSVSTEDKEALRQEGIIVIETDNPEDVAQVSVLGMKSENIVAAMADAILEANTTFAYGALGKNIAKILRSKTEKR